jgi:protease I
MTSPFRIAIITGPGFQDHDVVFTYYRAREDRHSVSIATKGGAAVVGKYGITVPLDKRSNPNISFDDLNTDDFDIVILTGGHEAPDRVRQDPKVKDFVRGMAAAGKVVAGLCHGPWIMISAGVLAGRKACAYPGLLDDMVNSGADVIEADVVVDDNIITCSYYSECGAFMRETIAAAQRIADGDSHSEPIIVVPPTAAAA